MLLEMGATVLHAPAFCQFAQTFSRTVIPSANHPAESRDLLFGMATPEAICQDGEMGAKLRGVGFGSGARYYTDPSGDALDTFSLPAPLNRMAAVYGLLTTLPAAQPFASP
jgi:hypothetical protein